MPAYTMQQLEALASPTEQGGDNETSRYQPHVATFQAKRSFAPPPAPRDVRRAIYSAVYSAGQAVSRAEIAKALGVKKTPWLCAHVERLVAEGYLVRLDGLAPNGETMYFYGVAVA